MCFSDRANSSSRETISSSREARRDALERTGADDVNNALFPRSKAAQLDFAPPEEGDTKEEAGRISEDAICSAGVVCRDET